MSIRDSRPRAGECAGVAAVVAFVVFSVVAGLDARTDGRRVIVGVEAADSFLDHWRASRQATYSANTVFTRTGPDETTVRSDGRRVQRPPDELIVSAFDSEVRRDDEVRRCVAGAAEEEFRCFGQTAGVAFDERVASELDALGSYLRGDPPLYLVRSTGDGCFDLEQGRPHRLAPYGRHASFCFDEGLGVLVEIEIAYDSGVTERTVLTDLDPVVDDTDLDLAPPG